MYPRTPGARFPLCGPISLPDLEAQQSSWVPGIQHQALYAHFQMLPRLLLLEGQEKTTAHHTKAIYSVVFVKTAQ